MKPPSKVVTKEANARHHQRYSDGSSAPAPPDDNDFSNSASSWEERKKRRKAILAQLDFTSAYFIGFKPNQHRRGMPSSWQVSFD